MPRNKTEAASVSPAEGGQDKTAEQLIAEHNKLDDWIKAETKRFGEFMAPHKQRLEEIGNQLLVLSNLQKWDSIKTEEGTAYRSTLLNVQVSPEGAPYKIDGQMDRIGREALLDFALDHWDDIGNDLLLISAQKDAVKRYMETNDGQPPPGIKVGWFTRINIRKS